MTLCASGIKTVNTFEKNLLQDWHFKIGRHEERVSDGLNAKTEKN